jgi:hypothetical protein
VQVIDDPVEARRLIDRFLARAARRDAYGELLARGQVSRRLEDPDARENLRRDLRRQARADKLKIITREHGEVVLALLDRSLGDDRKELGAIRDAYETVAVAERLGHQPRVATREHEDSLAYCTAAATTCRMPAGATTRQSAPAPASQAEKFATSRT